MSARETGRVRWHAVGLDDFITPPALTVSLINAISCGSKVSLMVSIGSTGIVVILTLLLLFSILPCRARPRQVGKMLGPPRDGPRR